ncbi:MAG: DUF3656 domain-containing protein, partial [Vallitaleaceae bacterium]|nr:DUF3656 domain-containing protein [Vallitaleaceae bacterium]
IQTLEILPALMKSGIHTFKIEGRMKNPNYVALMTALYRKYMDAYLEQPEAYKVDPQDLLDMHQIYNRGGFSAGYYAMDRGSSMMSHDRPNHSGLPIGYVSKIVDYKNIQMTLSQPVRQGDALEIGSRNHDPISFTAKENMSGISNAIYVGKHESKVGDVVHKMTDVALAEKIDQTILQKALKLSVQMAFKARVGEAMVLELKYQDNRFLVLGSTVESAKTSVMTQEKVETQLRKTGNDPVLVTQIDFDLDENIFISIKELNDLRREAIEKLVSSRVAPWKRQVGAVKYNPPKIVNPLVNNRIQVLLRRMDQLEVVLNYDIDALYLELSNFTRDEIKSIVTRCLSLNIGVYVALPRIIRDPYRGKVHDELEFLKTLPISGIMIRTLDIFERVKKDFNIVLDYTLNVFNKKAIEFWTLQGVKAISVSPELHQQEIAQLGGAINEVVVYGYLPLMVTTQCLHKNTDNRCHQPDAIMSLKDRKNMSFQVYKDCSMCFNTIYNALPVLLIDKKSELTKSSIHRFRIELLHENVQQIHTILSYAMGLKNKVDHSKEEMPITQAIGDFTRGHFAKGIK